MRCTEVRDRTLSNIWVTWRELGDLVRSSNLADTLMDHLEPLRKRILSTPLQDAALPWTRRIAASVGGLTEIGFADDSDLLLVVSSTGRSLFDCITGERIARDRDEPDDSWYDERRLRATGIGSVDGKTIRLCGLHGGGLPTSGNAGYWVDAIPIQWPEWHIVLGGPYGWIYDGKTPIAKLAVERELRAFGFSDTGMTLVIATSSDLYAYGWQG